jgi:lactate permease
LTGLPPLSVFAWFMAFLPILLVLVLMMAFRWSGGKAGAVSWIAAVIIAMTVFGADLRTVAMGTVKGLWTTVFVLYIIWGAMVLYQVVHVVGGFRVISDTFTRLTAGNREVQLLMLGFAFPSFVQGVCGFGAPVAIAAPLLAGIGFSPVVAAAAPLIGHAWSVTFGSLGSSYSILISQTHAVDLPEAAHEVAVFAVLPIALVGILTPWALIHMYGGFGAVRKNWPAIALMGVVASGTAILVVTLVTPFVGSFIAGLVTMVVGALALPRLAARRAGGLPAATVETGPVPSGSAAGRRGFHTAFSGYYILIFVVLGVYLTPLKAYLDQFLKVGLRTVDTATSFGYTVKAEQSYSSFRLLTSPGTLIFVSAILAFLVYRIRGWWPKDGWRLVARGAFRQAIGATVTVMTMSMMAVVMLQAGNTGLLAQGTAQVAGGAYPLFATFIGQLGAFMTGSNTNSNILFTLFQRDVAVILGISVPIILGLQTAGGATANMISPVNIALGTGSTSIVGKEGEILRRTLWYSLLIGVLVGVLGWLMQYVFFPGRAWLLPSQPL